MRALRLAMVLWGCVGCALGQGAKAGVIHYRITGTAVNDRNGEAIPYCHMIASPFVMAAARGMGPRGGDDGGMGPRQDTTEADADAHGRFVLDVPSEGRYRLTASATGFRPQNFEAHETFSTAVVLTKAAPVHAVVFRATSDAILVGEVTDEAGEAVRGAQMRLYAVGDPARTNEERRLQMRSSAMTDDRGHYELGSMPAGTYKMSVTGHPWYATQGPPGQAANGTAAVLDPSLDVVYPILWYPGTEDEGSGEKIVLRYGERRQIDFRMSPLPAGHLLVNVPVIQPPLVAPGLSNDRPQGPYQRIPTLQRVMPDGSIEAARVSMRPVGGSGQMEMGGLAPGTYQLTQPGGSPDAPPTVSIVHVTAGGTVSAASEGAPETEVSIKVDGDPTVTPNQVMLTDTTTGQVAGRGGVNGMGRIGGFVGGPLQAAGGPRGQRGANGGPDERTLRVPPGTYEVTVNGRDSFLTGLSATGATVTGRTVKIGEESAHLLVHMAAGMASIEGTANRAGKPVAGAMVVLVPATMGDPASLTFVRRAQTATDGSFQMANVIPGQYILLAIDHGWEVNWRSETALRPYLLQGEPLDLAAAATVHPALTAVTP